MDESREKVKKINSPADFGYMIRAKRKEQRLTQGRAAQMSGVGVRFLSELERGKTTAEIGKAMQVLARMGLELWVVEPGSESQAPSAIRVASSGGTSGGSGHEGGGYHGY